MYFKLNPEVIFVVGKKGSILCDSFNNKIYHLNKMETDILILAENNHEIDGSEKIFNELEGVCLGTFYEKSPYIQKVRVGSLSQTDNINFNFKKFFLEISNICNYSCNYCGYDNEYKRSLGCLGCNIIKEDGENMGISYFFDIIDTINKIGCEELYLTGGDLTLNLDFTKKIVNYCQGKVDKIVLISSYKHNFKKLLTLLGDNTFLILQVDLDSLTKEICVHENIIYLVVVPEDCEDDFFSSISSFDKRHMADFLIKNKNTNINLDMNYEFNLDNFFNNLEFHPCLGKTLFVSSKGNVYPCPLFRFQKWGNIQGSFLNFLNNNKEKIYNFWTKNLDSIAGCQCCEFRYICSDCRAIEEYILNESNKKFLCSYSELYNNY